MTANVNKSATECAYEVIRNAILRGDLAPGQRLTVRATAELTGTSVIPVIQALHRLEEEGLVESFPRWGSRVITLDRETIRDHYLLREAVECQVARILARQMTAFQASELRSMAGELDRLLLVDPEADALWDLDYKLHLTMAEFTGSKALGKALSRINLFRLLQTVRERVSMKLANLPDDLHRRLVDALTSGDQGRAEQAMREHIYLSGAAGPGAGQG